MLYKTKTVNGYTLEGYDGEIGAVMEFYFDDRHWAIRYLVAETGNWLTDRQVLISPYALVAVSSEKKHITVNSTKKQIEDSPSLRCDMPVSQQFEEEYHTYYEWPMYWAGPYMWGSYAELMHDSSAWREPVPDKTSWDQHLRSTKEVTGYLIHAADGELGHIEDFIFDDETWAIRYLVVNTDNWWPGKKVLLSTQWIDQVSWNESKVFVNISRETIETSPEYSDKSLLTQEYETKLHRHYNCQGYWAV